MFYNLLKTLFIFVAILNVSKSDDMFCYDKITEKPTNYKDLLNTTTGGPYTYSQSGPHFYDTGYDGS